MVSGVLTFQGKEDFSAEEEHVEEVLKLMQQALLEERGKLKESQEEVVQLKTELVQQQEVALEAHRMMELEKARVVEIAKQHKLMTSQIEALREEVKQGKEKIRQLWQTNCQQLVSHDNSMFEKEKEMQLLTDKLHRVEIELATLKAKELILPDPSGISDNLLLPTRIGQPRLEVGVGNEWQIHGDVSYPCISANFCSGTTREVYNRYSRTVPWS